MKRRFAEELQIGVEERLTKELCSVDLVKENEVEYQKALETFAVILRREFEGIVRRLQDFKVEKEDGVVEFRLEKPAQALKNAVELIEDWILPFCRGIGSGAEWMRCLNLIETLHVNLKERVEDLCRNERMGSCLSYEERFFVRAKVEAFRLREDGFNEEKKKKNRLRRKRRL